MRPTAAPIIADDVRRGHGSIALNPAAAGLSAAKIKTIDRRKFWLTMQSDANPSPPYPNFPMTGKFQANPGQQQFLPPINQRIQLVTAKLCAKFPAHARMRNREFMAAYHGKFPRLEGICPRRRVQAAHTA
jgi:hypothetical protein